MSLWSAVGPTLFSLASTAALLAAAWFLLRSWAGARIKADVESTYAKKLEEYRAELRSRTEKELEGYRANLEQERALHAAATHAFASAHSAAAERRLEAIQQLWDTALTTRNTALKAMLLFDIHTRAEIAVALNDPRLSQSIGNPSDEQITELVMLGEHAERARPFVSEPFWALFLGYRTLLGRILVQMQIGRQQGRIRFWLDDAHTRQILETLLDPAELQFVVQLDCGGIHEAQKAIELRIADEARRIVSGEASSDAALQRARGILDVLARTANPSCPVERNGEEPDGLPSHDERRTYRATP